MIAALVAEAVRYGRRLRWLVVPTIVLAIFALATRLTSLPERTDDELPRVTVRSVGAALPPSTAHELTARAVISGQVLDEQNQPVAGADLFVRSSGHLLRTSTGGAAGKTDENGKFELAALADGYTLVLARTETLTTGVEWLWTAAPEDRSTLHMRRGATIVVHAVELDGHTPIANAKIVLDEFQEGISGVDGTVTFHNVDSAWLTASAPGHGAVWLSFDDRNRAREGKHYWVTLPIGAPIAGTVVDPNGHPIPHAEVEISTIETPTWHRDPTPIRADEHGAWQLEGLAPGTYGLTVAAPDFIAAAPLRLAVDGKHARTGIELHAVYGAQLEGTILDHTGRPASNAWVSLRADGFRGWEGKTDERGYFQALGLKAGSYTISTGTAREGSRAYRVDLTSDRRVNVEVATVPTIVAGLVVDSRGQAVVGVRVNGLPTDNSGRFEMTGMAPGRFDLELTPARENMTLVRTTVNVGEQGVIVVMPGATRVTGRVLLHGQPVRSYAIYVNYPGEVVRPDDQLKRLPRIERTDGRFVQDGIYAGDRRIVLAGDSFATRELEVDIPEGDTFDLGDVNVGSLEELAR